MRESVVRGSCGTHSSDAIHDSGFRIFLWIFLHSPQMLCGHRVTSCGTSSIRAHPSCPGTKQIVVVEEPEPLESDPGQVNLALKT